MGFTTDKEEKEREEMERQEELASEVNEKYNQVLQDQTIDLYATLQIETLNRGSVNADRVRAAYAKLASVYYPEYEVEDMTEEDQLCTASNWKLQEQQFL